MANQGTSYAEEDKSKCSLYMAPASTVKNDGSFPVKLSMYAGVDMAPGTQIGNPEIAIPVTDMSIHNGVEQEEFEEDYFEFQYGFLWRGPTAHAQFEGLREVMVSIPGIGGLSTQHSSGVTNAELKENTIIDRVSYTEGLEGVAFPGRGANSDYFDVTMEATKKIPAGMEILVGDLGMEIDRKARSPEDYESADTALVKIQAFFEKHSDISPKKKQEVYKYLIEDVIGEINEEDQAMYPEKWDGIAEAMKKGGSFLNKYPETKKTPEWLEENGQCLDGLYPRKSTLPGAMTGAFATRAVQKGGLISPAPLLMIPDADNLDMYELQTNGRKVSKTNKMTAPQLWTNYCFGHPESSVLLYPFGMNVNYINHKSTKDGANAKVVWTEAKYHNPELLLQDPFDLNMEEVAVNGVGFDIIATRDIAADEEVFLDYGSDWVEQWDDHVMDWKASMAEKDWHVRALDLNAKVASSEAFFHTKEEREEAENDPVPEDIITTCYTGPPSEEVSITFDSDYEREGSYLRRCNILHRVEFKSEDGATMYNYTVSNGKAKTITDVPQSHIKYANKPYSSDMFEKQAFRHYIGIPDEMMPDAWRNLEDEEE
jgi:hypothetical protein